MSNRHFITSTHYFYYDSTLSSIAVGGGTESLAMRVLYDTGDGFLNLQSTVNANQKIEIVDDGTILYGTGAGGGEGHAFLVDGASVVQILSTGFDQVKTTGRILGSQGAAVASATNVTLGNDGNTFDITGTTTINTIVTTGWTAGSIICLRFTGNLTLNNGGGGDGQIYTTTGANKAIAAGAESWFVLRDIGGTLYWRETAYDA